MDANKISKEANMKLKLTQLKLSAVDKATGKEYGVRGYRRGPLDKNVDGEEVTLDKAHNGYPIPRRWDEVEVFIDLDADVLSEIFIMMWDAFKEFLKRGKTK